MAATKTLTATELAEQLKTDPRTVRKFIRDTVGKVGKGNRHEIKSGQVATLRKQFTAWTKSREAAAEKAAEAKAPKAEAAPKVEKPKAEKPKAPKPKVTKLPPSGKTAEKLAEVEAN